MARRTRMFGESMRLAEREPDLPSGIDGLLCRERSFVKWASLRGALAFVNIALEAPGQLVVVATDVLVATNTVVTPRRRR